MNNISGQLATLLELIRQLERKYNRPENCVKLLAVSKTKPLSAIETAFQQGQLDFGENYLQEALEKIQSLKLQGPIWHFIGPLQSNKTRPVAEHFHWVHSIDRLKIATRLEASRPKELPPINVCIQVNISAESSKSGLYKAELFDLAKAISQLKKVKLRGLMALPQPSKNFEFQRKQCRQLAEYYNELNQEGYQLDTLSMGTSDDLEAAIAEGATMVRIGTTLFGKRER